MFKLEEDKEKIEFQRKERNTFAVFIMMCLAVVASKVFFNYAFSLDTTKMNLANDLTVDVEILTTLSMSGILLILLY